jgi:Bacterial regulatory proteins, gntR family
VLTDDIELVEQRMVTSGFSADELDRSPGEKIVEAAVAQQLGVGQGLVREALIGLEDQGFVVRTPFSNARVSTLSDEDALQIFDIRIELEPLAFERAGRSLRPHDVSSSAGTDCAGGRGRERRKTRRLLRESSCLLQKSLRTFGKQISVSDAGTTGRPLVCPLPHSGFFRMRSIDAECIGVFGRPGTNARDHRGRKCVRGQADGVRLTDPDESDHRFKSRESLNNEGEPILAATFRRLEWRSVPESLNKF